jgi:hypothetical protein
MPDGTGYYCLNDVDMLRCQEALPDAWQKKQRMAALREAIAKEVLEIEYERIH